MNPQLLSADSAPAPPRALPARVRAPPRHCRTSRHVIHRQCVLPAFPDPFPRRRTASRMLQRTAAAAPTRRAALRRTGLHPRFASCTSPAPHPARLAACGRSRAAVRASMCAWCPPRSMPRGVCETPRGRLRGTVACSSADLAVMNHKRL